MNQVRMAGAIEVGLLADLLQLLSSRSDAAGCLELTADGVTGRTWIHKGQVVDAVWGIKTGEDAIRHMMTIRDGRFRFVESSEIRPPTIHRDTTCILLDCMRALDERVPDPEPTPVIVHAQPAPSFPIPPSPPTESTPAAPFPAKQVPAPEQDSSSKPEPEPVAPLPVPHRTKRPTRLVTLALPNSRQVWQSSLAALLLIALSLGAIMTDTKTTHHTAKTPVRADTAPASAPLPLTATDVSPIPSLWPRFVLSGLLATGTRDGEGAAVVNGEVVSVGERIDGMIIREISDNGITLEYQGNRLFQGMQDGNKRAANRPSAMEIGISALRDFAFVRNS